MKSSLSIGSGMRSPSPFQARLSVEIGEPDGEQCGRRMVVTDATIFRETRPNRLPGESRRFRF
jgi:hypothetical protein